MENKILNLDSLGKYTIDTAWIISSALIDVLSNDCDKGQNIKYFQFEDILIENRNNEIIVNINYHPSLNKIAPTYYSPEETGRINQSPDYKSNFYRLGLILYKLFFKQDAFSQGDKMKVFWQHIATQPREVEVEEKLKILKNIIDKLLSKTKDMRYQSFYGLRYDWDLAYNYFLNPQASPSITLGTKDLSPIFQLYDEFKKDGDSIDSVFEFIENINSNNSKGMCFIGESDSSTKSSVLQNVIHKLNLNDYKYFYSDGQVDHESPFKIFVDALEKYLKELVESEHSNLDMIKTHLAEELGDNLAVFSELSPEWGKILETKELVAVQGQRELLFRLSFVLSKVFSVLKPTKNPIVFLIDNFHQATAQSINLLQNLMKEADIKNFVLICSDNSWKEDNSHPLIEKFSEFLKEEQIKRIYSTAIDGSDYNEIFIKSKINPTQVNEVTSIAWSATLGNPFLLKEFMRMASQNEFIVADYSKNCWHVDIDGLRTINISNNIDEIISLRYAGLNDMTKRVGQICASIGFSFDSKLVRLLLENEDIEEEKSLMNFLHRQSIIIPKDEETLFQFVNQETYKYILKSLAPQTYIEYTSKITEIIIKENKYENDDILLFKLANYLTKLPKKYLSDSKNILKSASNKAMSLAAFDDAVSYLETILRAELFENENEKLEFQIELMEMWAANLNFDSYYEMRKQINDENNYNFLQRAKLDSLHSRTLMYEQKFQDSVLYSVDSLKRLGVNIVLNPSLMRIIYDMVTTTIAINKRSIETLKNLPLATDELSRIKLQLLSETTSSFFLASPQSLPEVISKTIKLALKEGAHKSIALIFATYGFSISAYRKKFSRCEEMIALAYEYDNKYKNLSSSVVCQFIHYGLTRFWIASNKENARLLMKNYVSSLEVGSVSIGYYSLGIASIFRFFEGERMSSLQNEYLGYRQTCIDKKQIMISNFLDILLQFIENINEDQNDIKILEGEYFSTAKDLPKLKERNEITSIHLHDTLITLMCLLKNSCNDRLPYLEDAKTKIEKTGLGSFLNVINYTFNFLCVIQDQNVPLKTAKKYLSLIKEWAGYAPFNFGAWYHLGEALMAQRHGDSALFLLHIDTSIDFFEKHDILYGSGLSKWIKLRHRYSVLKFSWHQAEIEEVSRIFADWGFTSAQDLVNQEFANTMIKQEDNEKEINIDFESLLKSSQLISSEIRTESILERLTQILIENAGADKVCIYQPKDGDWEIVAEKKGSQMVDLSRKPLNNLEHPKSLIQLVQKSLDLHILKDEININSDLYLSKTQPKSAMVFPVIKNNEIKAIIYFENSLVKGVFSINKVELIKVLAGQVATSLENASLYEEMGERVEARTKELTQKNQEIKKKNKLLENTLNSLKDTQTQLIQAEKMASLGELTAGIAHEIQNPLNFVNNFSEVSTELIDEMKAELKKGDIEEGISIADDLKQNIEKINHHGKRASSIVKGMLEHSRTNSDQKEPTDINVLADEYLRLSYHGLRAKDKSFNADYKTDFDPNLPKVNVVSQDIGRVILNLINNAFQAVGTGHAAPQQPMVTVSTRNLGDKIEISVKDNGPGIPDSIKSKIFQPFFTTKPTGQGTGLGLSLAYDIVKAHGGDLKVESKEMEGSEFIIQLPIF